MPFVFIARQSLLFLATLKWCFIIVIYKVEWDLIRYKSLEGKSARALWSLGTFAEGFASEPVANPGGLKGPRSFKMGKDKDSR